MIDNVSQLQELIEWCISKKVRKLSLQGIEFELSDLALVQDIMSQEELKDKESSSLTSQTMADTGDNREDEDLLYYSSRP